MRVALINPYPYYIEGVESTIYPPLGLLYIGGYIKNQVNSLLIFDANALCLSIKETITKIAAFKPDLVGISINAATATVAQELSVELRRAIPKARLIAGGPQPTVFPRPWLSYVDAVIVGEGEISFSKVIEQMKIGEQNWGNIDGVYVHGGMTAACGPTDPDLLPFPAYDHLDPPIQAYTKKARVVKSYMAPIITSRGCPYGCIFCDKSVHGYRFRPRTAESVLAEIKWLRKKFGINQIDILDDNFTFDINRAEKILDGLIEEGGYAINCQNGLRADRLNPNLVKKLKKAGLFKTGIGIESGSPDILKKIDKKLDLENVRSAIKWLRKENITVHGYFIIGFPFETLQDIKATLEFAKEANPHFANFSLFLPIPGTKIYNSLMKEGRIVSEDLDKITDGFFSKKSYALLENMSNDELQSIYKDVWRSFYFRPYKIYDIIKTFRSWSELKWVSRIAYSMLKRKIITG